LSVDLKNPIGSTVRYYREGWYLGILLEDTGFTAVIRPIGPKGSNRRSVTVPSDDVEKTEK
jgi:hypothetical protein